MKTLIFFSLLLIPHLSFASATENFIQGLKADLHFNGVQRAIELSDSITISPFGVIDQWMSPDAVATYNGKLNTIKLAEENLITKGRGKVEIKDARLIRGERYLYTNLSTIFHEMGHAELDIFIENKVTLDDSVLMHHYQTILKPYYKRNFSQNPHTVFHEHFAYYRSELINFMYEEQDNIFLANGFNKFKGSCFLNNGLRNILKTGISLEDFKQFFSFDKTGSLYRHKVETKSAFVRGKDLDLYKGTDAKEVMARTNLLFWGYHQTFYQFPRDEKDYVKRLNERSPLKETLASCREKIWVDYQSK